MLFNIAEDAKVDRGTNSITRLAINLSVLLDIVEDVGVGGNADSGDEETVKRLPFKMPNIPIE